MVGSSDQAIDTVITGLKRLGPEPFSPDFSPGYLQRRFKGSARPIKTALLDQNLVAGVGNIYADESLFATGIDPSPHRGSLPSAASRPCTSVGGCSEHRYWRRRNHLQ